jgi:tetratricopeptide (TPR) repeat protein
MSFSGYKAGKMEEALQAINRSLALKPGQEDLLVLRAGIFESRKDFKNTAADLESAVMIDPQDPDKWMHLAKVRASTKNPGGALIALEQVVKLQPDNVEARMMQAQANQEVGNQREAIAAWNEVERLDPSNKSVKSGRYPLYLAQQKWEEALLDLNEIIQSQPGAARPVYDRGYCYDQMGKITEAIRDYSAAHSMQLEEAGVLLRLATLQSKVNRESEALVNLESQLLKYPADTAALKLKASLLEKQQNWKGAEKVYAKLQSIDPSKPDYYSHRANILVKLARNEEALLDIEKALSLMPGNPDLLLLRASLFNDKQDFSRMIADLENAVEQKKDSPEAWWTLGRVRLKLQMYDGAFVAFQEAVKLNPNHEDAWLGMALTHRAMGNLDQALQAFNKVYGLNPDNAEVLKERYTLHTVMGNTDLAIEDLDQLIQRNSNNPTYRKDRGLLLERKGEVSKAIEDYSWYLGAEPDDEDIRLHRARLKMGRNEFAAALEDLNLILSKAPENGEAAFLRGNLNYEAQKMNEAVADYELAVRLKFRSPDLFLRLALCKQQTGKPQEAITYLTRFIEIDNRNPDIYFRRAALYQKLGRIQDALADLTTAKNLNPLESAYPAEMAKIYYQEGNYPDALSSAKTALDINASMKNLQLIAAEISVKQKNYVEAVQFFQKGLNETATADQYFEAAMAAKNLDQKTKALGWLNTAIEMRPQAKNYYEERAPLLKSIGEKDKAEEDYKKIASMDDTSEMAFIQIGKLNLDNNDFPSALKAFRKARELNPDNAEYAQWCGYAAWKAENPNMALEEFQFALKQNDTLSLSWYLSGKILGQNQNYPQAIHAFTRALELGMEPRDLRLERGLAFMKINKWVEAIADFSAYNQNNPQDKAGFLGRGKAYLELKQWKEAAEDFQKVLSMGAPDPQVHLLAASAYRELNEDQACIREISSALKLKSDYALGFVERARLYFKNGQNPQALKDIQKAIEIDPLLVASRKLRADHYFSESRWKEATDDLTFVVEKNPSDSDAWIKYAQSLEKLGSNVPAIAAWNAYLQLVPNKAEPWYKKALLEVKQADTLSALSSCKNALQQDSVFEPALLRLSDLLVAKRNYVDLIPVAATLTRLHPEEGVHFFRLGLALSETASPQKALGVFEAAEARNFKPDDLYAIRSRILLEAGDSKGALQDLQTCILRFPSDSTYKTLAARLLLQMKAYAPAEEILTSLVQSGMITEEILDKRLQCRTQLENQSGMLEDLNLLLSSYPPQASRLEARAGIHLQQNNKADAIRDYDALLVLEPGRGDIWQATAELLVSMGEKDKALPYYQKALDINPSNPEMLISRADLKVTSGDADGAIRDYTEALKMRPNDLFVVLKRADVEYVTGKYDVAVADYTRYLNGFPDNVQASYRLAVSAHKSEKYEIAVSAYTKAIEAGYTTEDPLIGRADAYWQLGKTDLAAKDYQAILSKTPEDVLAAIRLGEVSFKNQDYSAAIQSFTLLWNSNRNTAEVAYYLGKSFLATGKQDSGYYYINQSINKEIKLADPYLIRGNFRLQQNQFAEAEADFSAVLNLEPENIEALGGKAMALMSLGNADDAIGLLGQLLEKSPKNIDLLQKRISCWKQLKDSDRMLKDLNTLLSIKEGRPEDYLLRGGIYENQEKYADASADYTKYLSMVSGDYAVAMKLARLKVALDDFAGAAEAYQSAVTADPTNTDNWLELGKINLRMGAYEKAENALTEYINRTNEPAADIWLLRGNARSRTNKEDQAIEDYSEALRLNPNLSDAWSFRGILRYNKKQLGPCIQDLSRAIELDDRYTEALLIRGKAYYESGDFGRASQDFQNLFQKEPNNVDAGTRYARSLAANKDTTKALEVYSQLISMNETASLLAERADLKLTSGDFSEAVGDYDRILSKNPASALAYGRKGIAKMAMNDTIQAIQLLTQAISKEPTNPEWYSYRGLAKTRSAPEEALVDVSKAIELNDAFALAYMLRANIRYNRLDYAGAMPDYTRAIELKPDFKEAYFNRADAKAGLGDYRSAVKDYSKVIEMQPDYEDAYFNRGVVRLKLKDAVTALEDFKKCIELNPKNGRNLCHQGMAKLGLNQKEAGCDDMSRAGEMGYADAYEYIRKMCK